jgi:MFS family permease
VIAVISSLYLTKIQKFSEKEAGLIFASLGLAIALYSVVLSNLAKYIGLRGTLMLGNLMGSLGYLLVLLFKDRLIQILIILVFIMFAISINLTNTKLGIKYYTYPKSRSLAYTLYYLVFFVSAGFASGGVDFLTFLFPETVYTWIFSFGLGLYLITFVLSCFLAEIDLENEEPEKIQVMTAAEVVKVKGFWNFVAFIFVMMVIKSVYFHLTGTLPVYMDRRVENGSHFGLMMVIQQVILLAATPVCSYLVFYWDKYTIIVVGTFFTAASPLAMYYDQTYVGIVACVVIISVGESIYAPRLVDYAVEVAPKGAEAIYLGIAAVTNSLPLIITGITSALLMDRYCKADSDKSECHMVWLWIGGYAVSAVGTLFLFRRWIESHAV